MLSKWVITPMYIIYPIFKYRRKWQVKQDQVSLHEMEMAENLYMKQHNPCTNHFLTSNVTSKYISWYSCCIRVVWGVEVHLFDFGLPGGLGIFSGFHHCTDSKRSDLHRFTSVAKLDDVSMDTCQNHMNTRKSEAQKSKIVKLCVLF